MRWPSYRTVWGALLTLLGIVLVFEGILGHHETWVAFWGALIAVGGSVSVFYAYRERRPKDGPPGNQ